MKIGIIGAGSIGGLLAGYLAANGEDVYLFDTSEKVVNAINENGLHIYNQDEIFTVHPFITTNPDDVEDELEVVFMLVKSQHTNSAIQIYESLISDDTAVVTVQNGLTNMDSIREHVPAEQVYGGYMTNGANMREPGHVRVMGKGKTVIGGPKFTTAEKITDVVSEADLPAQAVEDPVPHIWDKQFISVGIKPVAALAELRHGPMSECDEAINVIHALINEAIEVAAAKEIDLISDDPIAKTLKIINQPNKRDKKSSILEDITNERQTEIEHINGAIAAYGKEEGVATPNNRLVTQLIKAKEQSYL